MPQTATRPTPDSRASERQNAILDAAAACFARAGFHRTTMQDVAGEAGMSPGNLYRYFASKDALIAGLVERDRAEMAQQFADAPGADLGSVLAGLAQKHFRDAPREKSMICTQIWAEATRDPAIRSVHSSFEQEIRSRFEALFEVEKARGALPPTLQTESVVRIIMKLADGLFVRRAAAPDYDPEQEIAEVLAVVSALLDGSIRFPDAESPE